MKLKPRNGMDTTLNAIGSLGIWIGILHCVIGVALLLVTTGLHDYGLFSALAATKIPASFWALVYMLLGVAAIRAIWEQSRRFILLTFTVILMFWIWTGTAWLSLETVSPHGLANYVIVIFGSLLILVNHREKT
jgi:hypothetical protein